jgi:hypothetical protein
LSQEIESCESLLQEHFNVLYDKGELNTIEEVKAAYMRVLGESECNVSVDYIYDITLQLYQSADPFGTAAQNFVVAQNLMLDEKRTHCFLGQFQKACVGTWRWLGLYSYQH